MIAKRRLPPCVKSIVGIVLCGTGIVCILMAFLAWGTYSPSFTDDTYQRLILEGLLLSSVGVIAILSGLWTLRANKKEKRNGLNDSRGHLPKTQ